MIVLISGLILFLGTHSIRIFANNWRTKQIERIGLMPWKGMYSIVSVVGFVLIIWGFDLARTIPLFLWIPPTWTRYLAAVLMLVAFILLAAAYVPGNRIKARLGHPMIMATKIWAATHLIVNGKIADVVLFGAFLIWAIIYFTILRRRDRLSGVTYPVIGIGRDLLVICIGTITCVLFVLYGHEWLIGVQPF